MPLTRPTGGQTLGTPGVELDVVLGEHADAIEAAQADILGKQPLDADLTAIAALTTTAFGRSLLEAANAAALRTLAALGDAATKTVGYDAGGVPIVASGTPDGTKFLRDDGAWAAASGGSGVPANGTDVVATSETTSSTSFVDLATSGPAVTVTTGTKALVVLTCQLYNSSAGADAFMAFAVSGASTVAASSGTCLWVRSPAASHVFQGTWASVITGLTAGSNTFTAKYSTGSSGTATFLNRRLSVVDMGS